MAKYYSQINFYIGAAILVGPVISYCPAEVVDRDCCDCIVWTEILTIAYEAILCGIVCHLFT